MGDSESPLEEQPVLLTTEPSLQPSICMYVNLGVQSEEGLQK